MSSLEMYMIEEEFIVDIEPFIYPFIELIESIVDPMDFALRLKPHLTHVNSSPLYRLYYELVKCDGSPISHECIEYAYWVVQECRSNDRVYHLVKELIRPRERRAL